MREWSYHEFVRTGLGRSSQSEYWRRNAEGRRGRYFTHMCIETYVSMYHKNNYDLCEEGRVKLRTCLRDVVMMYSALLVSEGLMEKDASWEMPKS